MKKIRIGNDFVFNWAIERGGLPEDLSSVLEKHLHLSVFDKKVELTDGVDYDITGNVIRIEVTPTIANILGTYKAEFHYILPDNGLIDEDRKCAVDVDAFQIVAKTAQADDSSEFSVTSDMAIAFKGDKGDSAYQVWLEDNPGKTKEDYFNWLQKPATDIAETVNLQEQARVEAESERDLRETARIQAENERLAAEIIRQSNESNRIDNEVIRGQNEAERISKENVRQSNENSRVNAEGIRVQNEAERVQAESGRVQAESARQVTIQEAVTATNLANEKANLANAAAQSANDVKTDYETVVKPDMIAKANYAQEQGNYAKAQGEAVDGRISEVEGKIGYSLGWYGIEFDETIANSACTRIGEMDLHRRLPIQNQMRRCLLLDNGKVNYYLHKDDSTKKADGTDAVLDGTDGQVMVEIPAHWRRFEKDGTVHRVKISDFKLEGFHFVPKAYRSAYEATVERSTNKLSSVVNMDADYRGGNNNSANDGASNTLLGRPATVISGTNFARYAKNRGDRWCMDVYHVKKTMDWLYYIEFANFNSQLPFNPALTAEGFKQGGLGNGVTDLSGSKWSAFNGYYPFIPMGYTNSLGNKTGVKPFDMPVEYDENIFTTNVPSYRGVENPFGHIWKWADGLKINIQADDAGGESQMFVCEDPLLFQHSNYDGYEKRGLLPRANGYISKMIMGELGELMPKEAVGGSTTYFADYWYTSLPASGESQRGVLFGGHANYGASAGLAYSSSSYSFSFTTTTIGSRLCFIP